MKYFKHKTSIIDKNCIIGKIRKYGIGLMFQKIQKLAQTAP